MEQVIYTTADREEIKAFVRGLPAALAGTGEDTHGIGAGFRARLGWSFFSLVSPNFDKLGRGQRGDDGTTWPRNTPAYLAYGKGPKSTRAGRGQMPQNRLGGPPAWGGRLGRGTGTGDLSHAELVRWWAIYGPWKAIFLAQGMPLRAAKARAASKAWIDAKAHGSSTKLKRLGGRRDQVLVDRGTLRRSLLPGELIEQPGGSASYQPSNNEQVFDETPGEVLVGSRNKVAGAHHYGKGHLPERRLWPKRVPDDWWEEIIEVGSTGLYRIAELYGGPPP